MPNQIENQASQLESACQNKEGKAALEQIQHMPKTERLQIIKQMEHDAKIDCGKVYIDKGELVFSTPFASAPKGLLNKAADMRF